MDNVIDELIGSLSKYYDSIDDKNYFRKENLLDCDFISKLKGRLEDLGIEYSDCKIDFLSKHLLYFYNYDKVCLLITKKSLESPNTGRVSNDEVFKFCESLIANNDDEKLEEIEDNFYMAAGRFSLEERETALSNVYRNTILERKYGVNPNIREKCNRYDVFSSCVRGTIEAVLLKRLGIKEYHQKLFSQSNMNGYQRVKK